MRQYVATYVADLIFHEDSAYRSVIYLTQTNDASFYFAPSGFNYTKLQSYNFRFTGLLDYK